jgi:lysine/ornithine N-monooxygenase
VNDRALDVVVAATGYRTGLDEIADGIVSRLAAR